MIIMKRLLVPLLLLGIALLPSGVSAARLGAPHASDLSASELKIPTHGKQHRQGKRAHPNGDNENNADADAEAEQEVDDDDVQASGQANVIDEGSGDRLISVGDVIPIAANIPILPVNNIGVIQLLNTALEVIPVCAAVSLVVEDQEDTECDGQSRTQEQSQLRHMEANAGNDEYNQSNDADQEQESESKQDQEADQDQDVDQDADQVNLGR